MDKRRSKRRNKVNDLDALEQINLNAAGIDIGAEEVFVAVPKGRDEESVRSFLTFTADLQLLADWLAACGVETVDPTAPYLWITAAIFPAARADLCCAQFGTSS